MYYTNCVNPLNIFLVKSTFNNYSTLNFHEALLLKLLVQNVPFSPNTYTERDKFDKTFIV